MHVLNIFIVALIINNAINVHGFNVEERNPIVKRSEKGSYFGFSVAQHKVEIDDQSLQNNWILVGAPLGQNLQPLVNRSGALFKCPITNNPFDCVQVETDGKRSAEGRYKFDEFDYGDPSETNEVGVLQPPGNDEIKEGQWLGVTVRSQKPGGKVMVCAHRYIQSPNLNLHHYGLGLCYLLKNNLEAEYDVQPCNGQPMEKLHQQYGFCQVGTSLALLDNGFALMGAPGPYTWRGTVFAREVIGSFLDRDKTTYRGPLNDDPYPIEKYSYLGMSVTGGYFFNKNQMTYASGAPRSQLVGRVYFFDRRYGKEELNITYILKGEQFGSSYGYEVLAMDINNDGYDDLIVGAPFYYEGEKYGGAIYIYTNLRHCIKDDSCVPKKIRGKPESRFGFSMTSLGDINKDGFADVAVGAPYEDDTGAIYIFLSSERGLNEEPSQIIRARHVRTLGYSLNGGLDMDNNGYPDLLVGAYESDMAVLFKTRPIVDISIAIEGDELKNINATKKGCSSDPLNTNNTCFTFKSCFLISDLQHFKKFQVSYQIHESVNKKISRVWFQDLEHPNKRDSSNYRDVEVTAIRKYCQEETVYIKEGIGDILSPIKFVVNYTLANNEIDSPILNRTSVKEFEATFQKSCGDDDICESNLVLTAGSPLELTEDGYLLDLAKNEEFILEANITNYGESAYEAKLFVVHPEDLSYIALLNNTGNTLCTYENDTLVMCNLGNPLQDNQSLFLKLRFEIKSTKKQKLDIHLFVNSTSKELSTKTEQSLVAVLQKIAQYTLEGKAITPHLFYGGQIKGQSAMKNFEDIGDRVYHRYEIVNNGQWQIQDMDIKIHWPYQIYSDRPEGGKWLLYLESTPKIEGVNNYCHVEPLEAVNPLKLNSTGVRTNEELIIAGGNFTAAPFTFSDLPENFASSNNRQQKRTKRDVEYVVKTETKIGPDGNAREVVTMDCFVQSARCALITCKIQSLNRNDHVRIQIYSRIWNSTLAEDYSKVDWVSIRSTAEVVIADKSVIHSNESIRMIMVETIAYPSKVLVDTSLNIWIIIGSVIAGFILLVLLIVILYKVGFFKRNRIKDQTLSGNLKKQGESESLLKINEGNGGGKP